MYGSVSSASGSPPSRDLGCELNPFSSSECWLAVVLLVL